ncbi:hypothetical protein RvY_16326 [Ramazzottius varieornatus]|uniref:RNA helicase n=1 Tax=Ramazzottius varieornatus TaxID=947166 RepID=A0A1D1VY28_RAMVA|nr:hypothetical protein RvY_16326 [Ramazzottius varieornatus]
MVSGMAPLIKRPASPKPDPSDSRLGLPVVRFRRHLAEFLNDHQHSSVFIVVSDTGSGKTTQIPQLLLDPAFDGFFNSQRRRIAVTQPRRVAAINVAKRVALEDGCDIGQRIGYAVRFEDCTSEKTEVKYMTDGMLMREAQADWMFGRYDLIILDEIHDRTVNTDMLLGLVKKAQVRRRKLANDPKNSDKFWPLKVFLMSATTSVEKLRSLWKEPPPVLFIPGRTFPVEINFTKAPVEDYIRTALVTVFQIHRSTPLQGDILVFLTGSNEIEDFVRSGRQVVLNLPFNQQSIRFVPLYASLPTENQMRALIVDSNARKVICCTNVAETSITIPGVKYVVDCGRVKSKLYTSITGMESLKIRTISQAEAWQRTGRAGREQAGVCYRLYSEEEFDKWPLHPVPEILRSNLASVLLQIIAMGLDKPLDFPFFDRPDEQNLRSSMDQLEWTGAVTQEVNETDVTCLLTADGKLMAKFPLDPRYARCLLRAQVHGCTEEVLTIIAMLSTDSPFFVPLEKRKEAALAHQKFSSNEGDHIVLLNVWRAFKTAKGNDLWCQTNFLNKRNIVVAFKILKQLREIMQKEGIKLVSCAPGTTAVRKALCEGLFMNTAEMLPDGSYVTLDTKKPVFIHPSSFLFKTKPSCVVYNELVQTTKTYIRDLCLVDKEWVDAVGKKYFTSVRQKLAQQSINATFS